MNKRVLDKLPKEGKVKVRFQKVGGVKVCSDCGMYLGQAPQVQAGDKKVTNEGGMKRECPYCGGRIVVKDFSYTGTTLAFLKVDGHTFKGRARLAQDDRFKKEIGANIAVSRAIKEWNKWSSINTSSHV